MAAIAWQPVTESERQVPIDVLRGVALFGVLLVNLMGAFRVSLFDHIAGSNAVDASPAEQAINAAIAVLVEFKAFTLFSFLFGVGSAIQSERASARGVRVRWFLARRFAILFLFGVAHIVFIWNGDILALYGVCGALVVALIGARTKMLWIIGAGLVIVAHVVPLPVPWPTAEAMRADAAEATRIYSNGSYLDILVFRCREAWQFILPLLLSSLPRTAGLMLLGVAAWRSGILNGAEQNRALLKRIALVGGAVGLLATCVQYSPARTLLHGGVLELSSILGLASAYGASVLVWLPRVRPIAAAGQMALTNYLTQSVVLAFVFYGFGLGLFGKLSAPAGLLLAAGLYVAQATLSIYWLRHFRYGPFEWVWRSLTYGEVQPLRGRRERCGSGPKAYGSLRRDATSRP
jgi:uncharacterized protein